MTKRIVVIEPDGTEREIEGIPSGQQMREIVGGFIELVRVLREDLPGFNYTWMIVNEEGLLHDLPRNQRATDLYLANVRRAYPEADNPHQAAANAYRDTLPDGTTVIDASPKGWNEDPRVVGTVIWFDGWTCEELERAGL